MNALIREAVGRGAVVTSDVTTSPVEQHVGDVGIGHGGGARPSPPPYHDDINERIRLAWEVSRGRISIGDVLAASDHFNG